MKESFDKKREFLSVHQEEVAPTLENDKPLARQFETFAKTGQLAPEAADAALEKFAAKIFFYEKREGEYEPGAKRIGLSASDPLTFGTTKRLIERVRDDRRCASIMLVTDNVAARDYQNIFAQDPRFRDFKPYEGKKARFPDEEKSPILAHLDELTAEKPIDTALAFLESKNSASGPLLFEWKSAYGARKLFLINEGWNGIGQRRKFYDNIAHSDAIDTIFCVDDFAAQILASQLPPEYAKKIQIMGADPLPDPQHAALSREQGRSTLGIGKTTIAFSFFSDVPFDFEDIDVSIDPMINVRTLENVIAGASELARRHPDQEYALLVRPHPRDGREKLKGELIALTEHARTPDNLKVLNASHKRVADPMDAIYAGDAMLAIDSTQNFLAPKRGRESVFLGFTGKGLGASVLGRTFGESYKDILTSRPKVHVVDSPQELADALEQVQLVEDTPTEPLPAESATECITRAILS